MPAKTRVNRWLSKKLACSEKFEIKGSGYPFFWIFVAEMNRTNKIKQAKKFFR